MAFKDRIASVASRLLTNFGETTEIQCTRGGTGAYDPSDLTTASSSPTTYTGVGQPTDFNARDIDGINVQENDTLLLFYSTTEPLQGDEMTINSVDYHVISVERIRVQSQNVMYKVQLRI